MCSSDLCPKTYRYRANAWIQSKRRSEGDKELRGRERLRSEGDKDLRGRERLRSKGEKELARATWVARGLVSRCLGRTAWVARVAWVCLGRARWSEADLKPPTLISISLSVSSFFFSAFFSDVLVFLSDLFIRIRN